MTGEASRTTITKAVPQFKHDFAMTNSGLHIQLPMDKFPVIRRFANDTEEHTYMHDLRFAFLACKVKRKPHLVAICLRVHDSGTFLRFSRTSFDGCTVHQFHESMYKSGRLPITNFNPVWISKAPATASFETPNKLPLTITRINFEVWYKGAEPVEKVLWSRMPDDDQQCHIRIPQFQVQNLFRHAPRTFMQSQHPIQHYVAGSIPNSGLALEVVAFRDRMSEDKDADVAFGVLDRNIWVRFRCGAPTASSPSSHTLAYLRQHLLRSFDFPTGGGWQNDETPIRLVPGSEGSFEVKQSKGGPKCNVQYELQKVGQGEGYVEGVSIPCGGEVVKGMGRKDVEKVSVAARLRLCR
jgi:hypothetical protein